MPGGTPSHDMFSRVSSPTDLGELGQCFVGRTRGRLSLAFTWREISSRSPARTAARRSRCSQVDNVSLPEYVRRHCTENWLMMERRRFTVATAPLWNKAHQGVFSHSGHNVYYSRLAVAPAFYPFTTSRSGHSQLEYISLEYCQLRRLRTFD